MSQFRRRPLAAAIAILFSSASPALAQQPAAKPEAALPEVKVTAPPPDDFRTESIPSATRTETPLRDIPQFINVVPQSVIESQGATSLQSALRNVPGITYTAPEGGTQNAQVIWLRGFPAGGDLFRDGLRDIGEYNRDLFATEEVQVLKGPAALIFGRGSTAGVINQVSKFADLVTRKEVALSLGSFGEKRVTVDLNLATSATSAFRIVALGENSDTSVDTVQNNQVGVAPSFRFGIGTDTDVLLGYYYLKTDSKTSYGQPNLGATFNYLPPPVSMQTYYGLSNYDFTDWETQIATFRVDHRFNDAVSLRNVLRWANYKRQMEATIPSLNTKDSTGAPVNVFTPYDRLTVTLNHNKSRDNDDTVVINQTDVTWRVTTGAVQHTVLTSLELAWENLDRWNYTFGGTTSVTTPYQSPNNWAVINYTKSPNTSSPVDTSTVSLLAQDQLEFSPEWKAVLGIRWDRYKADVSTYNTNTGVVAAGGGPFSRTDDMWSGRAGLIWQPTAAQSYYASWGNSYNPSAELGVYGGTATNLTAQTVLLDPEYNVSYEVGGQWDFAQGVQLRGAIFRNAKEDARMTDPVLGPMTLDGERRVDGVELALAGQLARNVTIYANGAYMDGKIVKSGNPLTEGKVPLGVPEFSGSIWTVYRFLPNWEVGGGMFASSYFWMDDQNRAKNHGYARFDATLAYVQDKYDIRLNVFNIFDTNYYLGGYQNNPTRVLPGIPLSAMLTFRYRFN
jgi:catecholate siderophore receptor